MEDEGNSSGSCSVTLEVEGIKIRCNRSDLTKNSDYFTAMFENDFAEKYQDVVVLKDVNAEAFQTILKVIHDKDFAIAEEQLLSVLQASCMLQFLQVKQICLEQVKTFMQANNCISIWVLAEHLDLEELCYKAKLLALLEFKFIKESDEQNFLELTLDLILNYLGNKNLQCESEFCVYQVLIMWYENLKDKSMDTLYKLLHCLNYGVLSLDEIQHIIDNPSITQFNSLKQCLECIKALKMKDDFFQFDDSCIGLAKKLLSAEDRNMSGLPCILLDKLHEKHNLKPTIFYYDKYKRKRKCNVLEANSNADYIVVYWDHFSNSLKKMFAIGVTEKLEGCKVIGHKNLVFLFGGEYQIGQGGWNYNFHIYDVIKEVWTKKRSPYPRRHFESCVCGNKLFVIGGTGPYRVIQKNMFWYDLQSEKFSSLEMLPEAAIQIKCCSFQNNLFILNINDKLGYIFDPNVRTWMALKIVGADTQALPSYSRKVTVFSYKDTVFIKENSLYELKVQDCELIIASKTQMSQVSSGNICYHAETVLIANTLYSLNKEWIETTNEQIISLESLNVNTKEPLRCFEKKNDDNLQIDDEKLKLRLSPSAMFTVLHPNLLINNDLINKW